MMATKRVNVLLPSGHRQSVKVTPNTTILQVLEEVCEQHSYKAEQYDIKHFNKVLDANASIRFTNLSNNAQLEMVRCVKERQLLTITIGLQLEDGRRLMGDFLPNTVLNDILLNLIPTESTDTAVVVYMHQEVFGEDLKNTMLKSLGLTKGKAMLRLLHRDPNKKVEQAHVCVPAKKCTSKEKENLNSSSSSIKRFISNKILDPINSIKEEISKQKKDNDLRKVEEMSKSQTKHEPTKKRNCEENTTAIEDKRKSDLPNSSDHKQLNIEFLGERNALVFNQASAKPICREELPDSFFDLTVDDAKVLLRDAKKTISTFEEAPLITMSLRELENNQKTANHLNKYKWAIIRIQFPDQLVLQGLFGAVESVQSIKSFVTDYLKHPEKEFILYTTPPKKELNPDHRLIDENLVPSSVIYYSGESPLKPELRDKLTDPTVATIEATKARKTVVQELQKDGDTVEGPSKMNVCSESNNEIVSRNPVAGSSKAEGSLSNKTQTPIWFKGLFK